MEEQLRLKEIGKGMRQGGQRANGLGKYSESPLRSDASEGEWDK